jgi:membrane protein
LLPKEAFILAKSTIDDLVSTPRGGLLSFGFLMALYFATNGINAMMDAFNQSIHIAEKRSFIHQQLISILLVFIQSFLLIIAIALLAFGQITLDFLSGKGIIEGWINIFLLTAGQWITIAALFYFAI